MVALRSLLVAYRLPTKWLCGGLQMALGGFAPLFRTPHFAFRIRPRVFTISILNTTPHSRLPRGGLGALWYHAGITLYP